jgi:transcriptional regulator of arginine metabolism
MKETTPADRLDFLRRLLSQGKASTQEEIVYELGRGRFKVTQSRISRDLRRLGAVKAIDPDGRTVYRLPDDVVAAAPVAAGSLKDLVISVESNNFLIVIRTSPGSASLVARHLDHLKPGGILGTIAGDDTIFVAPRTAREADSAVKAIEASLETR